MPKPAPTAMPAMALGWRPLWPSSSSSSSLLVSSGDEEELVSDGVSEGTVSWSRGRMIVVVAGVGVGVGVGADPLISLVREKKN